MIRKYFINNDNKYTIPRRAAWFTLRTLLVITFVVSATLFVFLEAMAASNIYILVTEGMELRANCIFDQKDKQEMLQYFSEGFVKNDELINDNVYEYYAISKFDYRLKIDDMNIWPWNKTATITVTERIPVILGNAKIDAPTDAVPEWDNAQFKVVCLKDNNRWYITKITKVKDVDKDEPRATPDMSLLTPTPKPTPTSTPAMTASDSAATPKP